MSRTLYPISSGEATRMAQVTAAPKNTEKTAEAPPPVARIAVLYRGATRFGYGTGIPPDFNFPQQRKLAALLRKRQALTQRRRKAASAAGDGSSDDLSVDAGSDGESFETGGGGHGGGQSDGRQQQSGQGSGSEPPALGEMPNIALSERPTPAAPPETNPLDILASQFDNGMEQARAHAVRDAWQQSMLKIRAHPSGSNLPLSAQLIDRQLELQRVEQQIGHVRAGGLAALRERAPQAGPSTASPSFNLLFPLLWLRADLPASAPRRARAIALLNSARNGVLMQSAATAQQEP